MRFIKIFTSLIFVLFLSVAPQAQTSFDRLYRLQPDRAMFGQSIQQQPNEQYVVLSTVDTMFTSGETLTMSNLTGFDPKGNINYSYDYAFEDTLDLFAVGNVLVNDDYFAFSAATKTDPNSEVDSTLTNIVVTVDRGGNVIWSKKYGSGTKGDPSLVGRVDILSSNDSTIIMMGNAYTDTIPALLLTALEAETGDIVWSRTLDLPETSVVMDARNMTLSIDSTLLITGSGQNRDNFFISEIDPQSGNTIWAELYDAGGILSEDYSFLVNDIAVGLDSSIVVTGIARNVGISLNEGLIASFDKRGEPQWAQTFNLGPNIITNGISVDVLLDGNIVVMAGGQDNSVANYFPAQIILTAAGNFLFANNYDIFLNSTGQNSEIIKTLDGGAIFAGSGIEHGANLPVGSPLGFYPRLIKTSESGISICETEITPDLDTLFLVADTLVWNSDNRGTSDSIGVSVIGYSGFTAPILSLRDTTYCPGDPVNFLLDATTPGATEYTWYDAEKPEEILSTDSTYVATEIGVQYVARVLVEEDLCYVLCDTTMLREIAPPMIQLAVDGARFCEERVFEVIAQPSGEQLTGLRWSTGAQDDNRSTIVVTDLGNYSATVTNVCEDTGTASVSITEADQIQPIDLNLGVPDPCSTPGQINLRVTNADIRDVLWSTGATTTNIAVTETGSYSVTATDMCNYEVTNNITISEDDFFEELDISIVSENCDNDQVDLTVLINSGTASSVNWSSLDANGTRTNLDGDAQIGVQADLTYEVEVRDLCGNVLFASISDPCQCLRFPNAFFPDSMQDDDINKEFGPVNSCSNITSYNLKIFNRWGQKVFESNELTDEWNGRNGSTRLRGDVYVYVAKYETGGGEFSVKGDVTLLR